MSHFFRLRTARVFWWIAASLVLAGATNAAEDKPAPRNAPGIWIEPRGDNNEDGEPRDGTPRNDGERREGERPGCPVNNRPLELLV